MRSGKNHDRAMSDAMSSGGGTIVQLCMHIIVKATVHLNIFFCVIFRAGSLISTDDHHHLHSRSHSPEHYPGLLNFQRPSSPFAHTNNHVPRHPHFPLHRRSASAGQKSSTFSPSPLILSSFKNPFASAPLVLPKSPPSGLCAAARPASALVQAAHTHLPLSLIEELKLVIARRASAGTPSTSPAPYSGITSAGASVFNHLSAPNAYYTPLLRALSPAEPPLERDVNPHSPGPAPITPPTSSPNERPQSEAPIWRTVPHTRFAASTTAGNNAGSLRGTSAGLLGDTQGTHAKRAQVLGTPSAVEAANGSADSTPSTEGSWEGTHSVFRTLDVKV